MKTILLKILLLAVILFLAYMSLEYWHYRTPSIEKGRDNASQLKAINKWFNELERSKKFNGTILIALKGKIVFHRNSGFADLAEKQLITDHSAFNLASVSKQFTACGILLLIKDGKVALEDPVSEYIPELSGYKGVTIRHLLHHTSGIPDYVGLSKKRLAKGKIITASEMISWLNPDKTPLYFKPGEKCKYSNTNYVLLAQVIERVSKIGYSEFMKKRIFDPLNMKDTTVFNQFSKQEILRERVFAYRKRFYYFGKNIADDLNQLDGVAGDGNIYSSALDLVKWDRALTNGALMPVEFYKQAYEPGRLTSGEKTGFSFGWAIDKAPVVYHYGGWNSFSSFIRRDLEKQTLLVVLSNSGFFLRTASICDKIIAEIDSL